jgi:hypothetical protein
MQGQVKTYRGTQTSATNQFRRDAARMAANGLVPTSQTWAAGSYGCGSFVLAFLLCFILVGFLIFLYMLIVKPAGTLTVTYAAQSGAVSGTAVPSLEKVCPLCAEHVKAAATVCRFCRFAFPEPTAVQERPEVQQERSPLPSPPAVQAGRSLAEMWRKKWFRVATYIGVPYFLIVVYVLQTRVDEGASKQDLATQDQAASSKQASQTKTDLEECKSARDAQIAKYNDLLKQGQAWEAAVEIRHCAHTLGDADMNKLVADAEVQSHLTTIRNATATQADKLQAMKMLLRDYPTEGAPYQPKIAVLEAQIAKHEAQVAKQQAVAEAARRRKQGVNIGMTEDEVRQSSWGRPQSVNRTVMSNGTHEQWVYSGGYLYFEDGVLTSIQN